MKTTTDSWMDRQPDSSIHPKKKNIPFAGYNNYKGQLNAEDKRMVGLGPCMFKQAT